MKNPKITYSSIFSDVAGTKTSVLEQRFISHWSEQCENDLAGYRKKQSEIKMTFN